MESIDILAIPGSGFIALSSADPSDAAGAAEILEAVAYIEGVPISVEIDDVYGAYIFSFDPIDEVDMYDFLYLVDVYSSEGFEKVLELEPLFTPYLKNAGKWSFDGGYFDGNFSASAMDAAMDAPTSSGTTTPEPKPEAPATGTPPADTKAPGMLMRVGMPLLLFGSLGLVAWSLR